MELPMNVIVAVVVTVIVLIIIALFAYYVKLYGSGALSSLFDVGRIIKELIEQALKPPQH
jgi:uncharacterized membrane protein YqiK